MKNLRLLNRSFYEIVVENSSFFKKWRRLFAVAEVVSVLWLFLFATAFAKTPVPMAQFRVQIIAALSAEFVFIIQGILSYSGILYSIYKGYASDVKNGWHDVEMLLHFSVSMLAFVFAAFWAVFLIGSFWHYAF